jgi:predicted metal-dependent peptidase
MSDRTLNGAELDHLAAARFTAIVQAPYLASILTAMTFVRASGLGTLAVDPRIRVYVDPGVLDLWTPMELAGVLLHEAHHVVRGHHERQITSGIAPSVFNIASDLEINDDLRRAGIQLPDGALHPHMFELPEHDLAEWYASRLLDQVEHDPGCGSGGGGSVGEFELGVDADIPGLDANQVELIRDTVARQIRAQGPSAPGGLQRWAQARLRSTVPWPAVLRSAVRRALPRGAGHQRHTWSRPRRHNPTTALLPSLRNVPVHVAVVVDSSGSMTQDHLDQAVSDIALLRAVPEIDRLTVVSCDTETTEITVPRCGGSVALIGGGGTSLEAGLIYVTSLRNPPDLIVVITDGLTSWPEKSRAFKVPVVAVVPDGCPPGAGWMTTVSRALSTRSQHA